MISIKRAISLPQLNIELKSGSNKLYKRRKSGLERGLTACYDLAVSPLTYDFAYAVAQAEVIRRVYKFPDLTMHLRKSPGRVFGAYANGESDWRLRHLLLPITGLLRQPPRIEVSEGPSQGAAVLTRPQGLHWLSDIILLAERGHDVQVLSSCKAIGKDLLDRWRDRIAGRRVVTITLREATYGSSRNSNLASWSSLARQIPSDRYAVLVLRDLERVSEPLPGDWGDAFVVPEAVWSIAVRMALYESAWLNLAVNNGPLGLLVLSPNTKFLIFKMIGGTWETTPQHFRRLGVEPGTNFRFLRPGQSVVWEDDEISVLRRWVLPALDDPSAMKSSPSPKRSADDILITAARRDYRCGTPAADAIGRTSPGAAREGARLEWGAMLLDEGRVADAARVVAEAAWSNERSLLLDVVSRSAPFAAAPANSLDFEGRVIGNEEWWDIPQPPAPALQEVAPSNQRERLGFTQSKSTLSLVQEVAKKNRSYCPSGLTTSPILSGSAEDIGSILGIFPDLSSFIIDQDPNRPINTTLLSKINIGLSGSARISKQAKSYLHTWLKINGIQKGKFIVSDAINTLGCASRPDLRVVDWDMLADIWPLDMLAALIDAAAEVRTTNAVARKLSSLIGSSRTHSPHRSQMVRIATETPQVSQRQQIWHMAALPQTLKGLTEAVRKDPDLPAVRYALAAAIDTLDPTLFVSPAVRTALSEHGILEAIVLILNHSGLPAARLEANASRLILETPQLRRALLNVGRATHSNLHELIEVPELHLSETAAILRSLLSATLIRDPELLVLLEAMRNSVMRNALKNPGNYAITLLERLREQIWIQEGRLARDASQGLTTDILQDYASNARMDQGRHLFSVADSTGGRLIEDSLAKAYLGVKR